jgi:hypothetical protein
METLDHLIDELQLAEHQINAWRSKITETKSQILSLAKFSSGVNTARVLGEKYKCKIQLPSKIAWDQKALSKINSKYPAYGIVDIAAYKVNVREYKKIINTVGDNEFNNFKTELMAANMGTIGTPIITVEELTHNE